MDPVVAGGAGMVAVVLGVLVLRAHQPRIGWLLVAHGVCFAGLLAAPEASTGGAGMVVDQLASGAWVFLFLWLALVGYLVPDGHAGSRFWRRWMQLGLVGVAAFMVGAAGDADSFRDAHDGVEPPLPWLPGPVSGVLGVLGLVATVLLLLGSALAVRARLRRSSGETRLQLLWLVWGATSLPTALVLAWIGHFGDSAVLVDVALLLAGVGLPVTVGIAVLRYRLFDIQIVLSRTLLYGTLVLAVLALYALMLFGADRLFGESTLGGLLAVGVVAVAVHPAYAFLRGRIERWVYGYRSDPTTALRRLGAAVESADPLRVEDTITASVAAALKVDRVWVEPHQEVQSQDARAVRVPLAHRGACIGDLVVHVPAGRELSAADSALLGDLARHAAVTIHAARLAGELQASRARIVTGREEERKRLRRDLHDGLGPSLAAILLKLRAAESRSDDGERRALLAESREETKAAIKEVRRVVDDLRPSAIDEVGLVDAIRQRADSLSTSTLAFVVSGPDRLPPLPAAVEVAAFRIASEAIANVATHSGASRCTVDLELDGTLGLTITDNGRGGARAVSNGGTTAGRHDVRVGWTSMVERAAELGGTCTISAREQGGLVVRAVLPCRDGAELEVRE